MATLNQIQANRLNAQKSTGPKTPEGKSVSSQNALKSGLDAESQFVLGETREEFALLQSEYYDRFAPTTPELRFQVDSLIRNEWMLRRFFRVEPQLWEFHVQFAERRTGVELGEVFVSANPIFMRLERRMRHAERAYKDAMTEIRRLQAAARPSSPATRRNHSRNRAIGFVSHSPSSRRGNARKHPPNRLRSQPATRPRPRACETLTSRRGMLTSF